MLSVQTTKEKKLQDDTELSPVLYSSITRHLSDHTLSFAFTRKISTHAVLLEVELIAERFLHLHRYMFRRFGSFPSFVFNYVVDSNMSKSGPCFGSSELKFELRCSQHKWNIPNVGYQCLFSWLLDWVETETHKSVKRVVLIFQTVCPRYVNMKHCPGMPRRDPKGTVSKYELVKCLWGEFNWTCWHGRRLSHLKWRRMYLVIEIPCVISCCLEFKPEIVWRRTAWVLEFGDWLLFLCCKNALLLCLQSTESKDRLFINDW